MVANDGAADSNPPVISTITINPPTPPTLDLDGDNDVTGNDYQTRYSLGGSPISISDDVLVGDADSVNLQSASIYLRTRPDGDGAESLLIDGALPGGITTTGFDRAAGTIELTGDASIADYQTAIAQIEYNNTIGLQLSDRLIEVIVNDGIFDSNLAVTTIDMVVPPYIDLDGNNSSFTQLMIISHYCAQRRRDAERFRGRRKFYWLFTSQRVFEKYKLLLLRPLNPPRRATP